MPICIRCQSFFSDRRPSLYFPYSQNTAYLQYIYYLAENEKQLWIFFSPVSRIEFMHSGKSVIRRIIFFSTPLPHKIRKIETSYISNGFYQRRKKKYVDVRTRTVKYRPRICVTNTS